MTQDTSNVMNYSFRIVRAEPKDVPCICAMIYELAEYERLTHLVVATKEQIAAALFKETPAVEILLGWENEQAVAFALFFHNFSTFLGRRGLYLEDLFVRPAFRRKGYGRALLIYLARLAEERQCGRFEWAVLDWNEQAIQFYLGLGATVMPDWRITRVTGPALTQLASQPLFQNREES